jgi:AraC family transcriptional regulator, regulatory protein of adaptative response / methylated-DNA-[protein]-cysteine methyltransferase
MKAFAVTELPLSELAQPIDDPRWQAVIARDASADGTFVYSVKSTGVYCRPSCASRRAKRINVEFYDSVAAAEGAGFRPCKRCRPNLPTAMQGRTDLIAQACRFIENAEQAPSLTELAERAGLSAYHFHRVFKQATGLTPRQYAHAQREKRMRGELSTAARITDAIFDAGFGSNSRFYEIASRTLGMKPREYRHGGANVTIRFAVGQCSLGSILVAQSERGVCAILLGDDPEALVRDLQDRFPRAVLIGGDEQFESLIATVVGLVEQPYMECTLPLDIRGTAFQQKVWQALRELPPGTTATYAEIARRIGMPNAVRAVAGACGANALAVAIPCHRVIRNDGSLSGYRWGVERKRALIERESDGVMK